MGGCATVKKGSQQKEKQFLPLRQQRYFKRKYKRVCGSAYKPMELQNFKELFKYLNLQQEVYEELYNEFKGKSMKIENSQKMILALESIIFQYTQEEMIALVYRMYFKDLSNSGYHAFAKDFNIYIVEKMLMHSIQYRDADEENLQREQALKKLQQLVANKQVKEIELWLKRYIQYDNFLDDMLIGGLQTEELSAYRSYTESNIDYQQDQKVILVNRYWIDKMVKYMKNKYEEKEISNSKFHKSKFQMMRNNDSCTLKTSMVKSMVDFYPGEINNMPLAKNFPWELKNNLRYTYDYVAISESVYMQFVFVFQGGPNYQRRLIKGCFELNPFIIRLFQYLPKDQQNSFHLVDHLKFSRSDSFKQLQDQIKDKLKGQTLYHRNPGCNWAKITQLLDQLKLEEKLMETSFAVLVNSKSQKYFMEKIMKPGPKKAFIGDMFKGEEGQVCVIEFSDVRDKISYAVVNKKSCVVGIKTKKQFHNSFTPFQVDLRESLLPKGQKGGIINLGNTCYLGAGLQALFSLRINNLLFNKKGVFGSSLIEIVKLIEEKRINVFPSKFKQCFDKKYPQFIDQENQHDVHQFFCSLFEGLQAEKPEEIKEKLLTQTQIHTKCKKCNKVKNLFEQYYIVTLPLKDFKKKTTKIDYVVDNVNIKTIIFEIDENSSALDWLKEFQNASGAKKNTYVVCEIVNSEISQVFTEEFITNKKFLELKIQRSSLIYAYSIEHFSGKDKLNEYYYIYKGMNEQEYIAKKLKQIQKIPVQFHKREGEGSPSRYLEDGTSYQQLFKIRVKDRTFHKEIEVFRDELAPYPNKISQEPMILVIFHFDLNYRELIGYPFFIQLKRSDPISVVKKAIQKCLGRTSSYFLRLSSKGDFNICELCHKFGCLQNCYDQYQLQYPVEWFEGIADFIIIWKDTTHYKSSINRNTLSYVDETNTQLDNFEAAYQRYQNIQEISVDCSKCKIKNSISIRKQKVVSWPECLIFHLGRIMIKNGAPIKLHTKWNVEQKLTIDGQKYKLRSMILHRGESIDQGHYVTIINGFQYDDETVSKFTEQKLAREEVYMLLYVRQKQNDK